MSEPNNAERTAKWGKVTWFSDTAGYGFIEPDGGRERLLFIAEEVDDTDGLLEEGTAVVFSPARTRHGQPTARNVLPLGRRQRMAAWQMRPTPCGRTVNPCNRAAITLTADP